MRAADDAQTADGKPNERIIRGPSFFLDGYDPVNAAGISGDARGIQFSADGNRAYIVNRLPPALYVYDTSIGDEGLPVNQALGQIELCEQPSAIRIVDAGGGPKAYLPCFATGRLWIIDLGTLTVEAAIDVGTAPDGIAVSTTRKQAYVTNYADDTIAVVDIDPTSPTFDQAIIRLGKQRN